MQNRRLQGQFVGSDVGTEPYVFGQKGVSLNLATLNDLCTRVDHCVEWKRTAMT